MSYYWGLLAVSEPKWHCQEDQTLFIAYRDKLRLTQFLMALRDDFESTRASILNRQPLPSLETAFSELIYEETRRLSITSQQSPFIIVAISFAPPQRPDNSKRPRCAHCHKIGHTVKILLVDLLVNLLVSRVLLQLLQLHPVLSLLLRFISFLRLTLRLCLIRLCHVLVLLLCLPLQVTLG
ncbi:hypothetical protein CFOL_v3_21201 [Cephalotus follicularis]|uniref:UBN2_3 domain-containing protein n=1 Tax=Cephalotus follicularis TaxID=3775 RepID=A0A1Q3CBX6_CEPFO|nr:hypothetical protein CFOL_v3_21201 [Cephalotus follicularis]